MQNLGGGFIVFFLGGQNLNFEKVSGLKLLLSQKNKLKYRLSLEVCVDAIIVHCHHQTQSNICIKKTKLSSISTLFLINLLLFFFFFLFEEWLSKFHMVLLLASLTGNLIFNSFYSFHHLCMVG